MGLLNQVVAYWYECIKEEDVMEKEISIAVKKKAVLYPFDNDPFIFDRTDDGVLVLGDRLAEFARQTTIQGLDLYYGYPVLFYFDERSKKHVLAPLFVIKVKFVKEGDLLYLRKDEQTPSCGLLAFGRLGCRMEEIADISGSLEDLFKGELEGGKDLANRCLRIIKREAELPLREAVDPSLLTNAEVISKSMTPGIYNKSLLFAGESTAYNVSLLRDLLELRQRRDLDKTALSLITENVSSMDVAETTPVLPFPSNEYQIRALQDILGNRLSVITGPPGTGKSQYICNLLINLFLEGRTVLFVSHTNEAVDVVNTKINEQFQNLMLRTGNKEFRQELKGKFNELILESERNLAKQTQANRLPSMWQAMQDYRQELVEQDRLEQMFEESYRSFLSRRAMFSPDHDVEQALKESISRLRKLEAVRVELQLLKKKMHQRRFSVWERLALRISPRHMRKRKQRLFSELDRHLSPATVRILRDHTMDCPIQDWDDDGWLRLPDYLDLLRHFAEVEEVKHKLGTYRPRQETAQRIRQLEKEFYDASVRYVREVYLTKMMGNGQHLGRVNSFLHEVDSTRMSEDRIHADAFSGALKVLPVWSCTLKSLRRTFPLSPGIFDYVIFDEASQVDLPSAAPALYRARNSIIVGDPMQLTHVAGLTRDVDASIARRHGLVELKDVYPSRTRYCDVSLYQSAENSLNRRPVFLANHYRSEDQIISLCNRAFYGGHLKIMSTLDRSRYPQNLPLGLEWVSCEGEVRSHPAGSRVNVLEAGMVNDVFQDVLRKAAGTNLSIGVVTPYSGQQNAIQQIITRSTPADVLDKHGVKILTAHKFQGSEKDIMIFSMVLTSRGNGNSDRWYNIYPQILNVALSRARYLLYIVGDKRFCHGRNGVLRTIAQTYDDIKQAQAGEEHSLSKKIDSPAERLLLDKLQDLDFETLGYRLVPKLVVKRYTLDFGLVGKKKIDIECDGCQHEVIQGFPVLDDVERDQFLHNEGWQVLRFPNHRILAETKTVISSIMSILQD